MNTDIFIYFDHKFIVVPSIEYIYLGKKYGVKILGTINIEINIQNY